MSKVTSKLQVTIPKLLAQEYEIAPGDDIQWLPAGEAIRVLPQRRRERQLDVAERVSIFDAATERQRVRQAQSAPAPGVEPPDRGWTRAELYGRGATAECD